MADLGKIEHAAGGKEHNLKSQYLRDYRKQLLRQFELRKFVSNVQLPARTSMQQGRY